MKLWLLMDRSPVMDTHIQSTIKTLQYWDLDRSHNGKLHPWHIFLTRWDMFLFPFSCADCQEIKATKCIITATSCVCSTSKRWWLGFKSRLDPLSCRQPTTARNQSAWPSLTGFTRGAGSAVSYDSPLWRTSISR